MRRSGFKTSDQVQGQGADRSGKRSIHWYVSIYRRSATQPLDLRWGFETTSVKAYAIQRSQLGFTLIEIVVVLILMAIISAYVIGRSVTTDRVEVTGQTDRIRNQIRFAQSIAMKQSNRVWGVKLDSNTNQYWFFSIEPDAEAGETEPDIEAGEEDLAENRRAFPGENSDIITFADLDLDDVTPSFTIFFNRIGKPYTAYFKENDPGNVPLGNDLIVTVSASGQSRTIRVVPETGYAQ
jgi:prepilin-type N-terminal cleavage/methylation domain-containing protein